MGIAAAICGNTHRTEPHRSRKRKSLPILILLLVGTAIAIILKITHNGLIIFYISLISIIISIYAITKEYIGKNK